MGAANTTYAEIMSFICETNLCELPKLMDLISAEV